MEELLEALPELYQPIFGLEESSGTSSRACKDRLKTITSIYAVLQAQLGRPLRVLDLGCAQAFFSLSLARFGATVTGVDFSEENIAVCLKLCELNPDLNVTFHADRIEEFIGRLQKGEFDLVLGLSVFHHLVHEHGTEYVVNLLKDITDKIVFAIFEFALDSEPLYWAESLPTDQRSLLKGIAFVHEVARHSTHLSEVKRPLYFASNHYWFLDGQAGEFSSWTDRAHRLVENAHMGTRRYYFSRGSIIKHFLIDSGFLDEVNLAEIRNESKILGRKNLPIPVPKVIMSGENGREAWLVREFIPGRLLVDLILDGDDFDAGQIIQDILLQLVGLEQAGLFHNDLRTWNILITTDGRPILMDHGSITPLQKDSCWPGDLILNFFIFVHELTMKNCLTPVHGRQPFLSPFNLSEPFREKFLAFWNDQKRDWSFKALNDHIENPAMSSSQESGPSAEQRWIGAIETRLVDMTRYDGHLHYLIKDLKRQLDDVKNHLDEVNRALNSIYSSRSWKITSPFRRASNWLKNARRKQGAKADDSD